MKMNVMTCPCGAGNSPYEHRCERCGRRIERSAARPDPENTPAAGRGSLARVAQSHPSSTMFEGVSGQGRLFPPDPMRVVQMPPRRDAASRTNTVSSRSSSYAASGRSQQSIPFPQPASGCKPPESTIYTNAPVAQPIHRVMAGALDGSMMLIGLGIFLMIFQFAGARIILNKTTMPIYAGTMLFSVVLYRLLWCLAGTDSVGTRWAGLRVITFDGDDPDRRQRLGRMLGSYISWMAGGLGLFWAIADEEKLAWHDHMSRTFPTPVNRVQYSKR